MILRRSLFVMLCCAAFLFIEPVRAHENLTEATLYAPKPSHLYTYDYVENDEGQIRRGVMVKKQERSYQIYLPPKLSNSTKPAPMVVLLHGAGRSGISLVEKWKRIADENGIILVGPTSSGEGWDFEQDGTDFMSAVLQDVAAEHIIDPKRVYLFGHSAGGVIALYLSIAHADMFAASAVHAAHLMKPSDRALIERAARKVPLYFMVGDNDPLFPVAIVKESAMAFAEKGHKTFIVTLDDHNHWYYDNAVYINRRAWSFFTKNPLP